MIAGSMQRVLVLMVGLILALAACSPTGVDDLRAADESQDLAPPAYATHAVLYGNALSGLDQNQLAAFDRLIVEAQVFAQLEARHRSRALLYFNPWGKSSYTDSLRQWTEWQPAPGELGEADVVLNGGVHCYRFDDAHTADFQAWVELFLAQWGSQVAGVFLDDFGYDRNWWAGDPADKDQVWGPADGRPGWREEPYDWNHDRIAAIESGVRRLVTQYCGADGELVVNGVARSDSTVRRFAEDVGSPNSESWDRLETPGIDPLRYARPGDLLQVNGVGASGQWGDWSHTASGAGEANLLRACGLALERGASVGLAYGVPPAGGGSLYSLVLPPDTEGQAWPLYRAESP